MASPSAALACALALAVAGPALASASLRGGEIPPDPSTIFEVPLETPHPPPAPEGELPQKEDDGAYGTKEVACQACRFAATGSCAMYKTCICHATNTYFGYTNIPATDQSNWKWACSGAGGDKYEECFPSDGSQYTDAFGDKVDPNALKCPE